MAQLRAIDNLASRLPRLASLAPRATPRSCGTTSRTLATRTRAALTAPKTELVYFGDTYKTSCGECKILSCEPVDEPKDGGPTHVVVLDRTIAYPAGGGQPSDTGRIVSPNAVAFVVTSVASTKDGTVTHLGSFETEGATPFAVDDEVTVTVDADRRLLHARIHSAGHLLDVAMTNIGFGPNVMVPAKGLHQPDQAYVEYTGKVDGLDKDKLMADLKAELTSLVTAGGGTKAAMMGYEEATEACGGELPSYIPRDSTPRVVTIVPDTAGCPCGGTHVADVKEIGGVDVTGVRVKKGTTRVSYTIEGMKDHA